MGFGRDAFLVFGSARLVLHHAADVMTARF